MQITILGASGKVGRLLVHEALRRGHTVIALTHAHNPFKDETPNLIVMTGDVHNKRDITKALKGSEAVISALSSWKARKKNVLSSAMDSVIPVMQANGSKRIISLTGSDARAPGDNLSLLHRLSRTMLMVVGRKVLRDAENHIKLLSDSNLDWTVVRSPVMRSKGNPFHFEVTDRRPLPWHTAHRQSVALCMIQMLENNSHPSIAPYIKKAAQ